MHKHKMKLSKSICKFIKRIWKYTYKKRAYRTYKERIEDFAYDTIDFYLMHNTHTTEEDSYKDMCTFVYFETFAYSYYLIFNLSQYFDKIPLYHIILPLSEVLKNQMIISSYLDEKQTASRVSKSRLYLNQIIDETHKIYGNAWDSYIKSKNSPST